MLTVVTQMSKKNKNNWQELEREDKHYKDEKYSNKDRPKRPYKRDKNPVGWDDGDADGDDVYYGEPYDETD